MIDHDGSAPLVHRAFCAIRESYVITCNASGVPTVYLYYHDYYYPLGTPASVAALSLSALAESIALAKRHSEFGQALPGLLAAGNMQVITPGYNEPEYGQISGESEPPRWLQELQPAVPRHTVPLACLRLPLSLLHQLLQLPADYAVKQVAVEEDALCIYCLTPECATMEPLHGTGNPAIHADYRLEERDGTVWRSLVSVRVESSTFP